MARRPWIMFNSMDQWNEIRGNTRANEVQGRDQGHWRVMASGFSGVNESWCYFMANSRCYWNRCEHAHNNPLTPSISGWILSFSWHALIFNSSMLGLLWPLISVRLCCCQSVCQCCVYMYPEFAKNVILFNHMPCSVQMKILYVCDLKYCVACWFHNIVIKFSFSCPAGGVLHCHIPLCDADCSSGPRAHTSRSSRRRAVLPVSWSSAAQRPTGAQEPLLHAPLTLSIEPLKIRVCL